MSTIPIDINATALQDFCSRHHLTLLAFFGSVLTDRFGPESDIDVLFDFDPKHTPTLFDVVGMEEELETLFGRKVDMVDMRTPRDLSPRIRDKVLQSAFVEYAA